MYRLFDIGGQKVDRRKWATMYDGLDAIFFCSAISEYDQKFEDDDDQVIVPLSCLISWIQF